MTAVRAFAPAKINLYLHVLGRRADGYHLLDSLIAFADIGDWVTAALADELSPDITGPESSALQSDTGENLVLRAARLLAETVPGGAPGAALRLEKALPVASGIGGGSSDAAATLRALCELWQHRPRPEQLAAIALRLGADTPACLLAQPVWAGGIGELLEPAAALPGLSILLVNPRRAVATPAIFKARQGPFSEPGRFSKIPQTAAAFAALLEMRRNDLTGPARRLVPEIAAVVEILAGLPGVLLSRMSGSGATCFALFETRAAAATAQAGLARTKPDWWSAAGEIMRTLPLVARSAL